MPDITSLRLFFDEQGMQEITELNPDLVHVPVSAGGQILDERKIYVMSTNSLLAFEQVSIKSESVSIIPPEASGTVVEVTYALDDSDSPDEYMVVLELPDGDYQTAYPVWRRVYVNAVSRAFRASLNHVVPHMEYVAD